MLEPEALSMYRECRRGALAQSRTLCSRVWPFRLEKSEGVLGNSGRKPEDRPQQSDQKTYTALHVHRSSRTQRLLCVRKASRAARLA